MGKQVSGILPVGIRVFCLLASFLFLSCVSPESLDESGSIPDPLHNFDTYLDELLAKYDVPSVALGVVYENEIQVITARGLLRSDDTRLVTVESKYHLGSNTKAMTALLAGVSVDRGEIEWDSTIADVLSGVLPTIPEPYLNIKLSELLSHTAGVPFGLSNIDIWNAYFTDGRTVQDQRRQMVIDIMKDGLLFEPGEGWHYSNFGIIIAGFMLETVTGLSWEELMEKRIFSVLGMESSGFGPPGLHSEQSEPWGHNPDPVNPQAINADNPPGLGPAGTVHSTLEDLISYARVWLSEGNYPPNNPLLSPDSFEAITRVRKENYGLGWIVVDNWGALGQLLGHDGSNTMFYSSFYFFPERDSAWIMLSNSGSASAPVLFEELGKRLIDIYF